MAEIKPAWIVALVIAGVMGMVLLMRTNEELQPTLKRAMVALQVEGAPEARVSPLEARAGTRFQLHAVVEATDWRNRTLYYTDAKALEIDGVSIEADRIRPWDRSDRTRILWFSVEGSPPYSEVSDLEQVAGQRYREVFQADWPQAWSVPGSIAPAVENYLPDDESRKLGDRFGIQRFHVRVEIFGVDSDLLPKQRLRSLGAADVEAHGTDFPWFRAVLESPLESLSRVFGLPQVETAEGASGEVTAALAEQMRKGLLFSRVPLLAVWLESSGARWEDLEWKSVELNGAEPWQTGAVIRAGSKVSFSYQDRGHIGFLDHADLCLDFDRGATVRPLGEVFVGQGLVEMASPRSF